jgi:hypothetical protein
MTMTRLVPLVPAALAVLVLRVLTIIDTHVEIDRCSS